MPSAACSSVNATDFKLSLHAIWRLNSLGGAERGRRSPSRQRLRLSARCWLGALRPVVCHCETTNPRLGARQHSGGKRCRACRAVGTHPGRSFPNRVFAAPCRAANLTCTASRAITWRAVARDNLRHALSRGQSRRVTIDRRESSCAIGLGGRFAALLVLDQIVVTCAGRVARQLVACFSKPPEHFSVQGFPIVIAARCCARRHLGGLGCLRQRRVPTGTRSNRSSAVNRRRCGQSSSVRSPLPGAPSSLQSPRPEARRIAPRWCHAQQLRRRDGDLRDPDFACIRPPCSGLSSQPQIGLIDASSRCATFSATIAACFCVRCGQRFSTAAAVRL